MGMVFQSYALWPAHDGFENVVYPLKLRELEAMKPKRRLRILELVGSGD